MISLNGITIANNPQRLLLKRQSLEIPAGTLTALMGRNGSGKSTLLRVICGTQKPLEGEIRVAGINPARAAASELASKIAVVTTESINVRNLTCLELVGIGRSPHTGVFGRLSADDRRAVDRALEATGMTAFANRNVNEMSDGEMRRIMLARALAQDTPVIVLDEPTSFLDVSGRYEICELLASLARNEGKTIVYSTHEPAPAIECADSIVIIADCALHAIEPAQVTAHSAFRDLTGGRIL